MKAPRTRARARLRWGLFLLTTAASYLFCAAYLSDYFAPEGSPPTESWANVGVWEVVTCLVLSGGGAALLASRRLKLGGGEGERHI